MWSSGFALNYKTMVEDSKKNIWDYRILYNLEFEPHVFLLMLFKNNKLSIKNWLFYYERLHVCWGNHFGKIEKYPLYCFGWIKHGILCLWIRYQQLANSEQDFIMQLRFSNKCDKHFFIFGIQLIDTMMCFLKYYYYCV